MASNTGRRRRRSGSAERPDMAMQAHREAELNMVLCGSDETLKASVLKCFMLEKTFSSSHEAEFGSLCLMKEKIHGRLISLVVLPALNQLSEDEVRSQTLCCVSLCDPGVHVFLLIVPVGPLIEGNKSEIEKIQKIFDSKEQFVLLFTTSLSVGGSVTDLIKSSPESQRLISLCGGQYNVMGLNESEKSRQIPDLLDYIENMMTEPYSLQMFVKAQENRVRHDTDKKYEEELKRMEYKIKELLHSVGAECSDNLERLRIVLIGRTGRINLVIIPPSNAASNTKQM
ncbi:hypothetical protein Q8A67_001385 [Cirrhinus molitorella]|uniref:AIG1-type G domain-containing protein n=1 Tax=Cirrhinus molitorella TaxID=172907 RepID=A0AA88Q9P7_9TELE|nr:hypothetical protein Q8A67_001385 [Cirrhinus molitorella]